VRRKRGMKSKIMNEMWKIQRRLTAMLFKATNNSSSSSSSSSSSCKIHRSV
jgi:hypothetical protein